MALVLRLAALGEKLPAGGAERVATWLVEVMGQDLWDHWLLVSGLVALGEKLDAGAAAKPVRVQHMEAGSSYNAR